jgi:putative addiction module component (TIGR02574 family)
MPELFWSDDAVGKRSRFSPKATSRRGLRYLLPHRLLMRPQLNGGTLARAGNGVHYATWQCRADASRFGMAKPALDLASLTPDEKLELIDDLWGSLKPEDFELTGEQHAELDRRLDRLDREGPIGTSWEAVRAKMSRSAL